MHSVSSRWRKPKCRQSKKSRMMCEIRAKRWNKTDSGDIKDDIKDDSSYSRSSDVSKTLEAKVLESKTSSSTAAKLAMFPSSPVFDKQNNDQGSYVLMNSDMWASLLSSVKCDACNMHSLNVVTKDSFGFSSKIELVCQNCKKVLSSLFSSPRESESKCFKANKSIVEAFLKIGKGHAALEVFSMALGVHVMDKKTFSKCLLSLHEEKKNFRKEILEISQNAVKKWHSELDINLNDDIIDITVSYDGTWQKRGHTSQYGIGIVIDVLTGLVVDYEILSKYCPDCTAARRDLGDDTAEFSIWFDGHKAECSKNYSGSSNAMEMIAAEILWKRSIKSCGMRYVKMLSDGDAKSYKHLLPLKVYGDKEIKKEECINHVAKRLGTALRNKVVEWRTKGVNISGRKEGSLKETTIVKLTNFYRKAIKVNIPVVNNMKTAIFATLFHCSSTDKSPKHSKCPSGRSSWCFYQRSIANGEKPKSHQLMKTQLSEDVVAKILPVYQRLASDELLSRCASGKTQNANESLHSAIWQNCPKEVFVSKKRLEMAVIAAVSEFNFGCFNSLCVEHVDPNSFSLSIAQKRDKRRIEQSVKRSSADWKKNKINKKLSNLKKTKKISAKEGETYGSGKF